MKNLGGRLSISRRRALLVLPFWICLSLWMWVWWFNKDRIDYLPLYIPLSIALFYEFALLPTLFLIFILRAKNPPRKRAPKNLKVAVVSLCVPAKESLSVIEAQLKSMSEIKYPHDSWILDEGNSDDVKLLARKYKVNYFTRKGIEKYNQPIPPFKAKTKAGNVNAWMDRVKRRKYDYFVQFDIDHIADPNYLDKTLGYFRDNKIAWVQAPSVYKNLDLWTAKGAAEQELVLQGPMQMGFYGNCDLPFIIGSHCTYRMSAIKEIGGFQPTRAEDHLDTVALASKGYSGVFLPEIIAEGDGPETLTTYLSQQFAWAYSMFQVLTHHTGKYVQGLSANRRFQLLFAQTWYPFWSLAYFTMFICPVVALVLDKNIVSVSQRDMITHFIPLFLFGFVIWWSSRTLMQPRNLFLSWRGMILHVARWPIVLKAVIYSLLSVKRPYMITPKGKNQDSPNLATYAPFLILVAISAAAVIYSSLKYGKSTPIAQMIFSLVNACFLLSVCLVDINIIIRKIRKNTNFNYQAWLKPAAAVSAIAVFVLSSVAFIPPVEDHLVYALGINKNIYNENQPPPIIIPVERMTIPQIEEQLKSLPYDPNKPVPTLGMYNSSGAVYSNQPYIEHTFAGWDDSQYLAQQILITLKNGNTPLLSIDPTGNPDGQLLLQGIASGQYDDKLAALSQIFGSTKQTIYIRFAHEMELANLYPWADQDPATFIAAYQHVVDYMRQHGASNVKWVWSPAGNQGADAYYPGDTYVDVIGVTVLDDQYWYGNSDPSFTSIAGMRLWLLKYNKPLWIVEFGVGNADPSYQSGIITEALGQFQLMGYSAIIYLNMVDANIVGPNYLLSNVGEFNNIFRDKPIPKPVITQPVVVSKPKKIQDNVPQLNLPKTINNVYSTKPTTKTFTPKYKINNVTYKKKTIKYIPNKPQIYFPKNRYNFSY